MFNKLLVANRAEIAIRIMRARQRLFDGLAKHVGRLRRPPACLQ